MDTFEKLYMNAKTAQESENSYLFFNEDTQTIDEAVGNIPVESRLFYPGGDAPRPEYEGNLMERSGQALVDIGRTATSLAAGGAAGIATAIPDLIALAGGVGSALFPGDKGRAEAFVDTVTGISERFGSEFAINFATDLINKTDLSEDQRQMLADAFDVGTVAGLPFVPQAAKAVARGARDYAAGAPERVAERATGTTLTSGVDPTSLIDDIIVGVQKQNATKRVQELANVRTSSEKGKITVDDLHTFFDEEALKRHGRKLNVVDNPDDYNTVKKDLIRDIKIQSKATVSGKGWYDEDVFKMFSTFANMPGFEELKDNETQRVIFSAILGVTSPGPKVAQNTKAGAAQYLQYKQTGKFSTEAPPPGTAIAGIQNAGFGQYGYPRGLQMLQHLLDTLGEEGTADFLLSPHTKGDLIKMRQAAGFKGTTVAGMGGKADSIHLGATIFGDKAGKFVLNINGYPATTKDKWFVRTIRRGEGTFGDYTAIQRDKKTGTEKVVELGSPRNISERQVMDKMVAELVNDPELASLNLSEQDAQAILWFREQNIYTELGVPSYPQTFSEGAELVSGQEGFGIRGGDEVKAAIEQGTEELPEYRSQSISKRTVKTNRREQLESLNNPERDGSSSKPYGRDSTGNAGRTGSLIPNAETQARYEKAGLRMPNIEIKNADYASEYFDAMKLAMSQHKYGAQVELKSVDDLRSLTMYRTSDDGGFALKPDGDIVAVFAPPDSPRGGIYATLQAAIEAGGKKLDAFDTMLPEIYETVGFRPVARVPWNDEYAPKPPFAAKEWDKETFAVFNNGEPDVILFVYDPNYFGGIDKSTLPVFDNYDDAAKIQDEAIKNIEGAD